MRLFSFEGSVHLSRQFIEKLTDSAIIQSRPEGGSLRRSGTWLAVACGFTPRSLGVSPLTGDLEKLGAGGEEMATSSLHGTDGVPRCPSRTT